MSRITEERQRATESDSDTNTTHSPRNTADEHTRQSDATERGSDEDGDTVRADTDEGAPEQHAVVPASAYKEAPDSGGEEQAPREAMANHIDTGVGSTALTSTEGWVTTHSREPHNDGRSHTRTYFDPNDVGEQYPGGQKHRDADERRSWATLATWQDGVQSDQSRGAQNWWADKQRWIDVFADQMGAGQYHHDQCQYVLKHIDLEDYQPDRIPVELIIIGILSLLIDNDIDDFEDRALKRANTEELIQDIDASVSDYQTVRRKLKDRDSELLFNTE